MAKLFVDADMFILAVFISPAEKDWQSLKNMFNESEFLEIYCKCSIEDCEWRDVKGLYKKAKEGKIADFTGITSTYEVPTNPDLILDTSIDTLDVCVARVIAHITIKNK